MKKQIKLIIGAIQLSFLLSMSCMAQESYKVTLDKSVNGSFIVSPVVPADGKVKAGTVLTVLQHLMQVLSWMQVITRFREDMARCIRNL